MMKTTILTIILFVLMLSASAVHAQKVETTLLDRCPIINCTGMPTGSITGPGSNGIVSKRFAVYSLEAVDSRWNDASTYCADITSSEGGWRLPTLSELQLMDILRAPLELYLGKGFTLTFANDFYWSKTVVGNSFTDIWCVDFGTGKTWSKFIDERHRARCIKELP